MKPIIFVCLYLLTLTSCSDYQSGILDIEEFKKEIREPYKSLLTYGISGSRGLRDGYFSEYHNVTAWTGKEQVEDLKCLSTKSEDQIYQISYFLFKGELIDIGTVLDDI